MIVAIFAGGKGTRLGGSLPKPLTPVARRPLVEHVIDIYLSQGFGDFLVLAGHRFSDFAEWVRVLRLAGNHIVQAIDTGSETQTGGRLKAAAGHLRERFMLTYADGLADVNLAALLEHHLRMRSFSLPETRPLVTLTAVNPRNRFGKVRVDGGRVVEFAEKMADECGWVNGGFYVVEPEVLDLIPGPDCVFEKDILPMLAAQGRVAAFQHPGDFLCVDTPRDLQEVKGYCKRKEEFWLRWTNMRSNNA